MAHRFVFEIAEHIPLKQGLRWVSLSGSQFLQNRRAYSIKTRIKTKRKESVCIYRNRRAYSIKTRIKTEDNRKHFRRWAIAEHIPLKQGLRLMVDSLYNFLNQDRRAYSIKTRIKTRPLNFSDSLTIIAEHIPLKQGLRLIELHQCFVYLEIAEHIPLKQGLRPARSSSIASSSLNRRAYSIKTRIKTATYQPDQQINDQSQSIFH